VVAFSVIVPTRGRRSLAATLDSVAEQLEPGDEILVRCSDDDEGGHKTRQSLLERAAGTHLVFIDDDDQVAHGALATMRRVAEQHPGRVAIFRMRYLDGRVLWSDPVLRYRNVSTQMFLVPNLPDKLARWDDAEHHGLADWRFISKTVELQGEPLFRPEIVAHICSDRRAVARASKRLEAARYRLAPRTRLRRALGRT
jgi:glycosyltransferase involved in cell wall biosynthesis